MRIYLDIDGVLADFVGATAKLYDFDPCVVTCWDYYPLIGTTEGKFWNGIRDAGRYFWKHIQPYPWMSELFDECRRRGDVTLLTAPPPRVDVRSEMITGRIEWIHYWFGDDFYDYFVGCRKERLAADDAVLIDDSDSNCRRFSHKGGRSILFPQPWNENRDSAEDRVKFTLESL
jgi:5'(3')-deoxyribonucleotidase